MMNERRGVFGLLSRLIDVPVICSGLYRLNVNRPMIRMMAGGTSIPIQLGSIRVASPRNLR
jgi:hypothetical protein